MDAANYRYMDSLFLEGYKLLDQLPLLQEGGPALVELRDATVLPLATVEGTRAGGVVGPDGSYVGISAFDALSPVDGWGGAYACSDADAVDKRVMYLGPFWRHWGHFLMDLISRLWYVLEQEPDITIVYDGSVEPTGPYKEFFDLLGIGATQLMRIERPTRFAEVVVPECSHVPGRRVYPAFARIFDRAAEQALEMEGGATTQDRGIYLTRTGLGRRIPFEVGERAVEELFSDNGFQIISPEKYSLAKQIALIRGAREVACLSGTLPHTMAFAEDGARLTILRKSNKPVYRQVSVDQVRHLHVTHVDAHISPLPVGPSGPFIVDINDNVRQFARDNGLVVRRSELRQAAARKKNLLWYAPVWVARNRGKDREVPLFDGEQFTTSADAASELRAFYQKRF